MLTQDPNKITIILIVGVLIILFAIGAKYLDDKINKD